MAICFLFRPSVFVIFPYCDIQSVFSLREIFCSDWAMPVCGLPFIFVFFVPFPSSTALGNLMLGGEKLSKQPQFWSRIADAKVIYVGETHSSPKDHAYE